MSQQLLFEEEQRFTQAWLWIPLIAFAVLHAGLILWALPLASVSLVTTAVWGGVILFLYFARLMTSIFPDRLVLHYFLLFVRKEILLEDIERAEVVRYRPLLDYGGWGIHYSMRFRRWAYNVSGNKGVILYLKDGRSLLIGSQRAEAFIAAIERGRWVL